MSRVDELASNHKKVRTRKKNIRRAIKEFNEEQFKKIQRKVFCVESQSIQKIFRKCLQEYLEREGKK